MNIIPVSLGGGGCSRVREREEIFGMLFRPGKTQIIVPENALPNSNDEMVIEKAYV